MTGPAIAGKIGRMSGMIHPEWWAGYVADAQERVHGGWATFGEAVGFLVGDLLTSEEFLSFLRAETSARMAAGDAFGEAIYAVAEEAAARLQPAR
jgi:hypothetical protein